MTYKKYDHTYVLRLQKGERCMASLQDFMAKTELKGGWLSGLGGVQGATLGFYDLPARTYVWRDFNDLYELTALQGNLAFADGELVVHAHGTFTGANFVAFGGHVKDFTTAGTVELLVQPLGVLQRRFDSEVGLKTLDLDA